MIEVLIPMLLTKVLLKFLKVGDIEVISSVLMIILFIIGFKHRFIQKRKKGLKGNMKSQKTNGGIDLEPVEVDRDKSYTKPIISLKYGGVHYSAREIYSAVQSGRKLLEEERLDRLRVEQAEAERIENDLQEYQERVDSIFHQFNKLYKSEVFYKNFLNDIPDEVFLDAKAYSFLESLILALSPMGKKILWSSEEEVNDAKEIEYWKSGYIVSKYFSEKFVLTEKYLHTLPEIDYLNDYFFVLLRLIQQTGSERYHTKIYALTGFEIIDIKQKTLDECLFEFYKFTKASRYSYTDPHISAFTHLLIYYKKFDGHVNSDYSNWLIRRANVIKRLNEKKDDYELAFFIKEINQERSSDEKRYSLADVDIMSGDDFEGFIAFLFQKMGYCTKVTKHSGDYGVDVIAQKNDQIIAIQVKCYSNTVPISAIQEISAGVRHYNCNIGLVVTNRNFTKAAIRLAQSNSIQLWDRKTLEKKISQYF